MASPNGLNQRIMLLVVALTLGGPFVFLGLRGTVFDSGDLFVYRGTEGPFEAVVMPDGAPGIGQPTTTFRAGGNIAYINNICFAANAEVIARLAIRRVSDGAVLWSGETYSAPANRPCEPVVVHRHLPVDLRPGRYVMERHVQVGRAGRRRRAGEALSSIPFEVVP